jgi:DNA polymerase-1
MLSLFEGDDVAESVPAPPIPAEPLPAEPHASASVEADPEESVSTDSAGKPPTLASHPTADDLIIVVDSHSLIYQVFHALPAMTSPQGVEVGAVHGFLRDIANLLQQWKPNFLVCAFDESDITFRNEMFDQYKAHREEMPEALRGQIGLIVDALRILGVPRVSVSGFEADDILATIAHRASEYGSRVLLVTSDKDCRQLITPKVKMLNVRKNELFGAEELMATWSIRPEQVVDFQALVGDSVDNVPGVPSIGPKAAQQLLDQFGSLDAIYENLDRVAGDKKREKLLEHRADAYLSRDLVRLKNDVVLPLDWEEMRPGTPDPVELEKLFRELGFRRLAESFLEIARETTGETNPVARTSRRLNAEGYRLVRSLEDLRAVCREIEECTLIAIDTETTSTRPRDTSLVGVSLCWNPGQAAYVPILGPSGSPCLDLDSVRESLRSLLADPNKQWIGQNMKFDAIVLRAHGMPVANIAFDTMVADYLLDAGGRNHDLGDIAKRWLGVESISIESLIGTGKNQKTMDQIPVETVGVYAAEDVDIPMQCHEPMRERLASESLLPLMETLELPLIEVLADMEYLGIRVDTDRLEGLRSQFASQLEILRSQIMEVAGGEFNPDSPKQLANVLFERLGLRVVKKTKTGPSTDAEVLEELAAEHPLPAKIIEYRQLAKLLSTYVESLPRLVSPVTGRVHTSYRQDIAATGRLSSVEPNLQNIPVRTPEGKSIRSAFVAGEPGWLLMTADYSQIELRVLAHCCGDPNLSKAFEDDIDIHTAVAAQVHGVPLDQVTSSMRRNAKAVSFGILYGQSPFGLAKGLGISRGEASTFIDEYFERYPNVRQFIAKTLIDCRAKGYVTTMSGRRRYLKGIRDFNALDEAKKKQLLEPERMAVNTVIQGSAADMIKLAMISVFRKLKASRLRARMLLQIHDELVFEVHPDDAAELALLVRTEMTQVMPLCVPLKVDVKQGHNWSECEPV